MGLQILVTRSLLYFSQFGQIPIDCIDQRQQRDEEGESARAPFYDDCQIVTAHFTN